MSRQASHPSTRQDKLNTKNMESASNTLKYSLTGMHRRYIIIHINLHIERVKSMRTTLNIEDELLKKASKLTGIKEKTYLVKLGLETLIARESSKRLAKLGGTEKKLTKDLIDLRTAKKHKAKKPTISLKAVKKELGL